MTSKQNSSYSAEVILRLEVGDTRCELSQVTPTAITLRTPIGLLPQSMAEVVMTIDDRETRWSVSLPDGASGQLLNVTAIQV